jgi:ABC-type branched-subunit amino acid transport system permease subunit
VADRLAGQKTATLALLVVLASWCSGCSACCLRRLATPCAPGETPMRAGRLGMNQSGCWAAFVIAGGIWAGRCAVCVFKGSISPDSLHVSKSVDALVMVLLGGVLPAGPGGWRVVTFTWLHDTAQHGLLARRGRDYFGFVLLFPMGIAGFIKRWVPLRWGGGRGA